MINLSELEAALLTCISYVDLNPVRAGIAETPETSDYTYIQARIKQVQKARCGTDDVTKPQASVPDNLRPFTGGEQLNKEQGLPLSLTDYLHLTDWTGRAIRDDK